jgi:hypothetical protein
MLPFEQLGPPAPEWRRHPLKRQTQSAPSLASWSTYGDVEVSCQTKDESEIRVLAHPD